MGCTFRHPWRLGDITRSKLYHGSIAFEWWTPSRLACVAISAIPLLTASRPLSRAQSYAKTVAQTSRLLVNRQRQLLVCRQRAQLQSELAQLKTRVGAGGDDRGETRRRAGA
eukprot:scaffold104921_cov34-Phaeocystis_antarctica.AAC.1